MQIKHKTLTCAWLVIELVAIIQVYLFLQAMSSWHEVQSQESDGPQSEHGIPHSLLIFSIYIPSHRMVGGGCCDIFSFVVASVTIVVHVDSYSVKT